MHICLGLPPASEPAGALLLTPPSSFISKGCVGELVPCGVSQLWLPGHTCVVGFGSQNHRSLLVLSGVSPTLFSEPFLAHFFVVPRRPALFACLPHGAQLLWDTVHATFISVSRGALGLTHACGAEKQGQHNALYLAGREQLVPRLFRRGISILKERKEINSKKKLKYS